MVWELCISSESYDTYDAFGNLRSVTGETYNPFRYCGEYMDAESGLIYLRNRYYDPSVGRFITEDPAKDGANWYVYCGNNPVNRWDPLGYLDTGYDANGIWHNWDAERFGYDSKNTSYSLSIQGYENRFRSPKAIAAEYKFTGGEEQEIKVIAGAKNSV